VFAYILGKESQYEITVLSVMTFCTFVREFPPLGLHAVRLEEGTCAVEVGARADRNPSRNIRCRKRLLLGPCGGCGAECGFFSSRDPFARRMAQPEAFPNGNSNSS
jgi:hypothetical protein